MLNLRDLGCKLLLMQQYITLLLKDPLLVINWADIGIQNCPDGKNTDVPYLLV